MAINTIGKLFISCHIITFCSVVFSIILSFKNPYQLVQPLMTSILLHIVIGIINLRSQSNIPFPRRLLMNESIHIIPCNLVFIALRRPSFYWILSIGLTSLYHILAFLTTQFLPSNPGNTLLQKCQLLFQKLTANSMCEIVVAMLEIMTLVPSLGRNGGIFTLFYFLFYLFWFILYRYATSNCHRLIWGQLRQQVATLAYKLPSFLCRFLMNILNTNEQLGTLSYKIYHL